MIRNTIVCLLIFLCFCGIASAADINIDEYINTNDKTPSIEFIITNGAEPYHYCILWVDNIASGSVTLYNNSNGLIICNRTLEYDTYIYNISARSGGEFPYYSSNGILKISYFGNIIEMLESIINIFTPIVTIIIKVIPIFIVISITTLLCLCIDNIRKYIRGKS